MSRLMALGLFSTGALLFGGMTYGVHSVPKNLPQREFVEKTPMRTVIPDYTVMPLTKTPLDLTLIDCNSDGNIDALCIGDTAYWYTPDWRGDRSRIARPMTNEIRNALNSYVNTGRTLTLMLFDEVARQNSKIK